MCSYSKTNFTVLCVSDNFTVCHEIKTRCALSLLQAKILFTWSIQDPWMLAIPATKTMEFCTCCLFTWKTNAMLQTGIIQQAIAYWLSTTVHTHSSNSTAWWYLGGPNMKWGSTDRVQEFKWRRPCLLILW